MLCYLYVQNREITFVINNVVQYAFTNLKGYVGGGHSNHRAEASVYDTICSLE